jgi:chromosome segregation ATPase
MEEVSTELRNLKFQVKEGEGELTTNKRKVRDLQTKVSKVEETSIKQSDNYESRIKVLLEEIESLNDAKNSISQKLMSDLQDQSTTMNTMSSELTSQTTNLAKFKDQISELENSTQLYKEQCSERDQKILDYESIIKEKSDTITKVNHENEKRVNENKDLLSRNRLYLAQIDKLQKENLDFQDKVSVLGRDNLNFAGQLELRAKEIENLKEKERNADFEEFEKRNLGKEEGSSPRDKEEIDGLLGKLKSLEGEVLELTESLDYKVRELEDERVVSRRLGERVGEIESNCGMLTENLDELKRTREVEKLENTNKMEEIQNSASKLKDQDLTVAKSEIESYVSQISTLTDANKKLVDSQNAYKGSYEDIKRELHQSSSLFKTQEAELSQTKIELGELTYLTKCLSEEKSEILEKNRNLVEDLAVLVKIQCGHDHSLLLEKKKIID